MKRMLLFAGLITLTLSGCSVAILPQPSGMTQLEADGQTLSAENGELAVSVQVADLQVAAYSMVDNLTSFLVTIENRSTQEVDAPATAFILFDSDGQQYRAVEPEKIQGMISRDSAYLIPYPYVGYYYLEDDTKAGSINAMQSSREFFAENHPQDIFTQALPDGPIIPGAKISGLIYFNIDLTTKQGFELRLYQRGAPASTVPDFTFAFDVEKN